MSNYAPGQTHDAGQVLFLGDYLNRDTPLWLSMFGTTPGPGNVQVSSMTVNGGIPGFIEMQASTISTVSVLRSEYAPIIFQRGQTDETTYGTDLKMNISKSVQGITPDEPFLSVTKDNAVFYDDLAVSGVQIFGDDFTDPTVGSGCVGYLTGSNTSVTLRTKAGGSFNTSTINVATANAQVANISTLNVSSITANSITATTFISSSTAVSQNLITNDASISTARISSLTSSRAYVSGNLLASQLLLNTDNVDINSQFALKQSSASPSGGVDMIAAPTSGGKIRMFTGAVNVNSVQGSNLSMEIRDTGTVNIFRDLNVSTISTTLVNASTLNTNLISTGTIRTNAISISTINFRPSISPNVDLGLGGAIGGLLGGAAANGFNTLLGAAALGTGIAGLVMPRTSGGVAPGNFQTIAGTSQIQFSTLGAPNNFGQSTSTALLTTTNGIGAYGSTITQTGNIKAGSWAFRTVSDPLNLATSNATLGATSTIQAASQWFKVFPGNVSMGVNNNNITSLNSQNFIDMGGATNAPLQLNANFPSASGDFPPSENFIALNPVTEVVIGWTPPPPFVPPPGYNFPGSALRVSTINGLSSINNIPFPTGLGVPIGSMLMWPVGRYGITPTAPAGYLLCDGSLQSGATYPDLSGLLGNSWNPNYPAFNPPGQFYLPDSRGRMPAGAVPSTYVVQATFQGVVSFTLPDGSTTRQGARFNQIQIPVTGGPAQLYRGMVMFAPFSSGGNIESLFAANSTSGSSWYDDMYVLFSAAVFPVVPPVGTTFTFIIGDSTDIPVIGLTNTVLGSSAIGYGQPYRVQQTTEVGVHTHPANGGQAGGTTTLGSSNPIQGTNTGNPNGHYSVSGVGTVAEAYPQNPANFGVNYIIKAL